jgi:hypothetical protein
VRLLTLTLCPRATLLRLCTQQATTQDRGEPGDRPGYEFYSNVVLYCLQIDEPQFCRYSSAFLQPAVPWRNGGVLQDILVGWCLSLLTYTRRLCGPSI